MLTQKVEPQRYLAAVVLGAVIGGIIVAIVTKALPKIMSEMMTQMMSEMPQKMMAQMKAEGIDPPEMCQRMMANFNQRQSTTASPDEGRR